MINKVEGTLKIRDLNKKSIGITIPTDLKNNFEVEKGIYTYSAIKENNKIIITLEILFKESN